MVLMSMAVGSEVCIFHSHPHTNLLAFPFTYIFHIHISPSQIMCMIGTSDLCTVPESWFASYTESIIYSLLVLASYSWCWWTTAQDFDAPRVSGYSKCVTIMGDRNADLTTYYQMIVFVSSNSLLCWSKGADATILVAGVGMCSLL